MDFSDALHFVKGGQKVAREGWDYLTNGDEYIVLPLNRQHIDHVVLGHVDQVAWYPNSADMLALDWKVVP